MEVIMKVVKSLEDSGLLLKGVSETIQNEAKGQKEEFLSTLLGTLGASLLRYTLSGKGAIATSQGQEINRTGNGALATRQGRGIRAGYGYKRSVNKNV